MERKGALVTKMGRQNRVLEGKEWPFPWKSGLFSDPSRTGGLVGKVRKKWKRHEINAHQGKIESKNKRNKRS